MIHQWIGFFVASKHINYILHEFAPVKYSNSKKRIHNKNFGAIVETTAQFSLVTKPERAYIWNDEKDLNQVEKIRPSQPTSYIKCRYQLFSFFFQNRSQIISNF